MGMTLQAFHLPQGRGHGGAEEPTDPFQAFPVLKDQPRGVRTRPIRFCQLHSDRAPRSPVGADFGGGAPRATAWSGSDSAVARESRVSRAGWWPQPGGGPLRGGVPVGSYGKTECNRDRVGVRCHEREDRFDLHHGRPESKSVEGPAPWRESRPLLSEEVHGAFTTF